MDPTIRGKQPFYSSTTSLVPGKPKSPQESSAEKSSTIAGRSFDIKIRGRTLARVWVRDLPATFSRISKDISCIIDAMKKSIKSGIFHKKTSSDAILRKSTTPTPQEEKARQQFDNLQARINTFTDLGITWAELAINPERLKNLKQLKHDIDLFSKDASTKTMLENARTLQKNFSKLNITEPLEEAISYFTDYTSYDAQNLSNLALLMSTLKELSKPSPQNGLAQSTTLVTVKEEDLKTLPKLFAEKALIIFAAAQETNDVSSVSQLLDAITSNPTLIKEEPRLQELRNKCLEFFKERAPILFTTAVKATDDKTRERVLSQFSLCLIKLSGNPTNKSGVYSYCLRLVQEALKAGTPASKPALKHFLRGLTLQERNELQKNLFGMFAKNQQVQETIREIFRDERIRTAIAISCDESAKNRELQWAPDDTTKRAISEEANVAIFSLSRYAKTPLAALKILQQMFEEDPKEIPAEHLENFALKWAQAHQHLQLPPTETTQIKEVFGNIVSLVRTQSVKDSLLAATAAIASPPSRPELPPGGTSARELLASAITNQRTSNNYKAAIQTFSNDLFNMAAAEFLSTSPAAMATTKDPGQAFLLGPHFNNVVGYVVNSVVNQGSPTDIERTLQFWIDVAKQSFSDGDLFTTQAILAALANSSVSQLIKDNLGQTHFITKNDAIDIDRLSNSLSSAKSYTNYRIETSRRLHEGKPVIPYIGVYCSDATFTIDGNKDPSDSSSLTPATIQLLGTVIHNVDRCQQSLPPSKPQQTSLVQELRTQTYDDREAYARSKAIRRLGELRVFSQLKAHQKLHLSEAGHLDIFNRDLTSVVKSGMGATAQVGAESMKSATEILLRFQREERSIPKELLPELNNLFNTLSQTQWMKDVLTVSENAPIEGQKEVVSLFNQVASHFKAQ